MDKIEKVLISIWATAMRLCASALIGLFTAGLSMLLIVIVLGLLLPSNIADNIAIAAGSLLGIIMLIASYINLGPVSNFLKKLLP